MFKMVTICQPKTKAQTKRQSLIQLNVPSIIPMYKPKKRRIPYKRFTLVLWFIGVIVMLMFGVLSLSFNSHFSLGKEASVGGKADVKVDVPLVNEHMFQGEINLGVKTETTTTSTTTSTLEYTSVPLESALPTTTTTFKEPVRDYANTGVSYRYDRDKEWLGPCGR